MQFEVVDRPAKGGGNLPDPMMKALIETKQSNKAIRVKLEEGASFVSWQAAVRARLRNHGLRLRARYNKPKHMVTCWAEDFQNQDREVEEDIDLGVAENGDQ